MNTSLYVDRNVLSIISALSVSSGRSKTFFVKKLLYDVERYYGCTPTSASLIKYQRHCPVNGFTVFHFCITPEEKDYFEQMRVKYKCSISFLLLVGFLRFICTLIKKYGNNPLKNNIIELLYSYTYLRDEIISKLKNYWMIVEIEEKKDAG